MENSFEGKTVLVTGGTGSFGQTMARKLLSQGVQEVRIFSRDESKQDAMRHDVGDSRMRYYIGDVRDLPGLERASSNVDFVFHAAALKQVPSCEFFPMQAVMTNILGSENVVRAAESAGVKSLVCLSTDKAVYPVNAMGMSKALMEKVAISHGLNDANAGTTVSCVRYGNVMYSRGSVIPLFIRQLKAGTPVTVTNPQMTRFMMSLSDSVALVEHAFLNAVQGDLFVKKAPACTVATLVDALGVLFNVEPHVSVIGVRHAEKMYEVLASQEELARSTDMGSYIRVSADNRDLNYSPYFEEGNPSQGNFSDFDSNSTHQMAVGEVVELLASLPEVQNELSR